jgi:proline-specific peptidase
MRSRRPVTRERRNAGHLTLGVYGIEHAGLSDTPEYGAALAEFYRRHLCRLDPWPDDLVRGLSNTRQEVAEAIWGHNDFAPTGPLKDWDVTGRLHEIHVPTLTICGRYDLATPTLAEELQRGIRGAELVVIEGAAHAAHAEKPAEYVAVLDRFFSRVEDEWQRAGHGWRARGEG